MTLNLASHLCHYSANGFTVLKGLKVLPRNRQIGRMRRLFWENSWWTNVLTNVA